MINNGGKLQTRQVLDFEAVSNRSEENRKQQDLANLCLRSQRLGFDVDGVHRVGTTGLGSTKRHFDEKLQLNALQSYA